MTYKSYIKKDYKMIDGQIISHQPLIAKHHFPYLFIAVSIIAGVIFYGTSSLKIPTSVMIAEDHSSVPEGESAQYVTNPSETTDSEDFMKTLLSNQILLRLNSLYQSLRHRILPQMRMKH